MKILSRFLQMFKCPSCGKWLSFSEWFTYLCLGDYFRCCNECRRKENEILARFEPTVEEYRNRCHICGEAQDITVIDHGVRICPKCKGMVNFARRELKKKLISGGT